MDQHDQATETGMPPLDGPIHLTDEERAGLMESLADAEAGMLIPAEEVFAWLYSLDTDQPLPRPEPRLLK